MTDLAALPGGGDPARLAAYTEDMTRRARWAIDHNDGHPEPAWSTGERLNVALVLGDHDTLGVEGYTSEEAAQRLGGDLGYHGYPGGPGEWISEIRATLGIPEVLGMPEDSGGPRSEETPDD